MGLSENRLNPKKPNGFSDHYPYEKWLAIIGKINPTFSDIPTSQLQEKGGIALNLAPGCELQELLASFEWSPQGGEARLFQNTLSCRNMWKRMKEVKDLSNHLLELGAKADTTIKSSKCRVKAASEGLRWRQYHAGTAAKRWQAVFTAQLCFRGAPRVQNIQCPSFH